MPRQRAALLRVWLWSKIKLEKIIMSSTMKFDYYYGIEVEQLGHRETARLLTLIYNQISKNKKTFIIAEHDTMFLNYCSYFAELRRKGRSTSIVFQGNREQLFKDKKMTFTTGWQPIWKNFLLDLNLEQGGLFFAWTEEKFCLSKIRRYSHII
jgi:hypothetical protein